MTKRPEPAFVTIGVSKDDDEQPLITADGRLVGTVAQVKNLIAAYELVENNKHFAQRVRAVMRDPRYL